MSGATITLTVGDTSHKAVALNLNLDGTPASGVTTTFSSGTPSVCTVDPVTGALNPLTVGTATINESSVRGAFTHTDFGIVTVQSGVSPDDFTTSLTFS